MSKYPSSTMTDSNICTDTDNFLDNNIITKINNTLQDNNDMIYINIMKRINYIASMFSTMEHMYNNKNKYNFGYLPYYLYSTIIKDKEQLKNMDKNDLNTYIDNLSYKYLYKCYDYNYSIFDKMKIKILILCLLFNFDNKENILIDLINYNNFNNSIYNLYILYNDINKFLADNNIDNDIKFKINIIFNYMFDVLYNQNVDKYKILDLIINNYLIIIFKNIKEDETYQNKINKINTYLNNIILNFNVSILSSEINGDFNILKYIDDIENNLNGKIISIINQQDIIENLFNENIISIIDYQYIRENINKKEIFKFFLSINPNNSGININIFQPSILYKNRLNKELLFNYIYTSIYMYGNNKTPANENYDKYIGRQHEFLLSNVYSELIDHLIITDNQTKKDRENIYSDNNIVIYHSKNDDDNILLKIRTPTLYQSFINYFCKDKYNDDCKIKYNKYNIETDILNKLYIDSEYIFCKITNDVNKLINICYLIDSENFDKLIQPLQNYYNITLQTPENFDDNDKLNIYIDIIKNYCFLFKPLQHLSRYYSNNINKSSNDIYVERYNIKNIYNKKFINDPNTGGDLYSIFNGNFFIIDSKFKKDPNMCSIIRTLSQAYLYMNVYYKPLCRIKNIDTKTMYNNSLYKTYYLCYINSFTNDLIYLEYENFHETFNSKIKNYHFSTRIKKYKDDEKQTNNDNTKSKNDKQILNIATYHINNAYTKYIENNNDITNSTTFNKETCQTILNNSNMYYIVDDDNNQTYYKKYLEICLRCLQSKNNNKRSLRSRNLNKNNDIIIENNNNRKRSKNLNKNNDMIIEDDNNDNLSEYKSILDNYTISNRQQQYKQERAIYACCKLKNNHKKCSNDQINCKDEHISTINESIKLINEYNKNNNNNKRIKISDEEKARAIKACEYMMYKDPELYEICKNNKIHLIKQNTDFVKKVLKQNTK